MLIRIIFMILVITNIVFSYTTNNHARQVQNFIKIFERSNLNSNTFLVTDIMNKNMELMKEGAKSPDADYADILTIPNDWFPKGMKGVYNTSLAKWEHVLYDEVPKPIEDLLKRVCKDILHTELMYADDAIPLWYSNAVTFWKKGEKDSALYEISRCCHLIQDITVPMHCKSSSLLVDSWNILNHQEANHKKFERLSETYITETEYVKLYVIKDLKKEAQEIAKESRKIYRLCDQKGSERLTKNPLTTWITWIIPSLKEDYEKAIEISNERSQKYTVLLLYTFFNEVLIDK